MWKHLNLVLQGMIEVAADDKGGVGFEMTELGLEHAKEIEMQETGAEILKQIMGD